MRRTRILIWAVGAMALAGCTHRLELPPNFVELEDRDLGPYAFRAVSPDGVVLAVKTQANPKKGSLEFWAQATENELTGRGYALAKTERVESSSGVTGEMMTFKTHKRGQEFTYILAVYVRSRDILLAEAGGKTKAIAPQLDEIRKALLTAM